MTSMRITPDCQRIIIYATPTDRDPKIIDYPTIDECLRDLERFRHDLDASYVDVATGYRVTHSAPFECSFCDAAPEASHE